MSDLMLHTKVCNVQIYVTHRYEMCSIRIYVMYENVICPNVSYTRKAVLCQKGVMSEPVLHTEILCRVFNVRTYVTHE